MGTDFNGWRTADAESIGLDVNSNNSWYLNFFDVTTPQWADFVKAVERSNTEWWLLECLPRVRRDSSALYLAGPTSVAKKSGIPVESRKLLGFTRYLLGVGGLSLREPRYANIKLRDRGIMDACAVAKASGWSLNYQLRYAVTHVYDLRRPRKTIMLPHDNPYHTVVSYVFPYIHNKWMYNQYSVKEMHKLALAKYRLMCA